MTPIEASWVQAMAGIFHPFVSLCFHCIITLVRVGGGPRGQRVQYLVCVFVCLSVCLSVCVLPQNCCKLQLSQNLNKLQVTNLVI